MDQEHILMLNDLVYSNSTGTTALSDANYKIDNGSLYGANMVVERWRGSKYN